GNGRWRSSTPAAASTCWRAATAATTTSPWTGARWRSRAHGCPGTRSGCVWTARGAVSISRCNPGASRCTTVTAGSRCGHWRRTGTRSPDSRRPTIACVRPCPGAWWRNSAPRPGNSSRRTACWGCCRTEVALPDRVRIVEVGPRDGLQNERAMVPTAAKIELVDRLSATGLQTIEATSFVSPKWVPQLADAAEVFAGITRRPGVSYPVLVPNLQGYERALAAGAREVAVFTAASEAFNLKNTNAGIDASLERFAPVLERARADGV